MAHKTRPHIQKNVIGSFISEKTANDAEPGHRIFHIMFFLASIAAIRHHALRIERSSFSGIINFKDSCSIENQDYTNRISINGNCPSYRVSFSSYKNILHQDGGTYGGGALSIQNINDAILINNTFENTVAWYYGGAIYFNVVNSVESVNNTFKGCKSDYGDYYGGSLYFYSVDAVKIIRNDISKSSSNGYGGSIYIQNSENVEISDSIFNETTCNSGGGALLLYDITGTIQLNENRFINCISAKLGGALYFWTVSGDIAINGIYCINCKTNSDVGGAIYYYDVKKPLVMTKGLFDYCNTTDRGGSIFFSGSMITTISNFNFSNNKASSGGALYFESGAKISIDHTNFEICNSDSNGGSIYFPGSATPTLSYVIFSNCKANSGGAMYFKSETNIIIDHSKFENCKSDTNGGAFSVDTSRSLNVEYCNFTKCSALNGNGGGAYLYKSTDLVSFKNNNFTSCTCTSDGSSIYYFYNYFASGNQIKYYSENNIFNDSEGKSSGAVHINSYLMDSGHFINDIYYNCKTNGKGGAVLCKIGKAASYIFDKCSFSDCSSDNCGAIGFEGKNDGLVTIKFNGCGFEKCISNSAACIGIISGSNSQIQLYFDNYEEIMNTFQTLTAQNNYAIEVDASIVNMANCLFNQISTGVIKTLSRCTALSISTCNFTACNSENKIINSSPKESFIISNSYFKSCGSCFQIATIDSTITLVTFNDTTGEIPSSLTGNNIQITDFNLFNHKESIQITNNNIMTFKKGKFIDFPNILTLTSDSKSIVSVNVENLSAINSRMFSVAQSIGTFTLKNSEGSYISRDPESILTSNADKTEINNCEFSRDDAYSLVFGGGVSIMTNCNITGDGPNINVKANLTLSNCTFNSENNPIFDISSEKGNLFLFSNSNCIFTSLNDSYIGFNNIFDQNGNRIERFTSDNNQCRDDTPPTHHFSYTQKFESTNYFISSEKMSESKDFSHSKLFIESNKFSNSNVFIETKQMSNTNKFSSTERYFDTNEFSISKSFIATGIFKMSQQFVQSNYMSNSNSFELTRDFSFSSFIQIEENNAEMSSINQEALSKDTSFYQKSLYNDNPENINSVSSDVTDRRTFDQISSIIKESKKLSDSINSLKQDIISSISDNQQQHSSEVSQTNNNENEHGRSSLLVNLSYQRSDSKYSSDIRIEQSQSSIHQIKSSKSITDSDSIPVPENNLNQVINKSSTGMITGIVVGIIAVIIIALVLAYFLAIKKNDGSENDDQNDYETEFETSNSTDSLIDLDASYVTQELSNTLWSVGQTELENNFFNNECEEMHI